MILVVLTDIAHELLVEVFDVGEDAACDHVALDAAPDEGLREFTQITELGLVQKGVTPLGNWRNLGMGDYSKIFEGLTSYSVAATVPIDVDALIPSGVFAQAFFDPLNPCPEPTRGTCTSE